MTGLRDALAAALHDAGDQHTADLCGGRTEWLDAVLSDPDFRAALTEAVAEALDAPVIDPKWVGADVATETAAAIVARMLEETT